jgi:hypothetical protein
VPIDTSVPNSPGWWMQRLSNRLQYDRRRFDLLEDHYAGRPPLPWGSDNTASRFYRFQQTSRTNLAALTVQARASRIALRSVQTAAADDAEGDQTAWRLVTGNDLDVQFPRAARLAFTFGRAYFATSTPVDDEDLAPITAEDPRTTITESDPLNPQRVRAALKLFHDETYSLDVAILWLPGEKHVAVRQRATPVRRRRSGGLIGIADVPRVTFNPTTFVMRGTAPSDDDTAATVPDLAGGLAPADPASDGYWSETYDSKTIPVQPVECEDGVGVFELHLDLLDRINHLTFMLLVITTLQAFRQRGLKQNAGADGDDPEADTALPEFDEDGQPIDYASMFEAGPDSMWILPPGVDVWESQQGDVSGILNSIRSCLLLLSAVTQTPMFMFTPDAATQTAEGASVQTDGIVLGVESFLRGAGRALARIIALAFDYMGDESRADASQTQVNFAPVDRYSLSEKTLAAQAVGTILPFEDLCEQMLQMSPQQIRQAMTHRAADQAQQALAAAAAGIQAGTAALQEARNRGGAPAPAPAA